MTASCREPAIRVEQLTKTIGGQEVLSRCSLSVAPGEILAVIGPNGAGKTTLLKTLAGLVHPTAGTVEILGQRLDPQHRDELLPRIGSMIDVPEFYPHHSALGNLYIHLAYMRLEPAPLKELLIRVGLHNVGGAAVRTYSLGMKQRLALARCLSHRPAVILLDEPTNGVDPTGIREFRDILQAESDRGAAVMIASHGLTELERVADSAVRLDHGLLSAKQPMTEILDSFDDGLEGFYQHGVGG